MWEGLLQALGAAGTVLDTPASIARGLAAAPFTGEWDRPFTGILDPEQRVYGSEWTGDPWSGMAVDMATDPLNVLGGVGLLKGAKAARLAKANNARRAELLASGGMPEEIAALTKIVDESGKPLKTYHGTGSAFDQYDMAKADPNALYGKGIYTTADPAMASTYADNALEMADPRLAVPPKDAAAAFRQYAAVKSSEDPRWAKYLAESPDELLAESAAGYAVPPWKMDKLVPGDVNHEISKAMSPMFDWDVPPANVRAQFLDARNPLNLDSMIDDLAKPMQESLQSKGINVKDLDDFGPSINGNYAWSVLRDSGIDPTEFVRSQGFDALTHTGGRVTGGRPHQVAIALDPSQIYSPWIAPAAQRVPRQSPLLAALLGYNTVRGSGGM